MHLSDSTATWRTEVLAGDLIKQLCGEIKNAEWISLPVDESTDTTDNAHLMVFVMYYHELRRAFVENVYVGGGTLITQYWKYWMKRDRCEESCQLLLMELQLRRGGREDRFSANVPHPHMTLYYCIIHKSVLCASRWQLYSEIMATMMGLKRLESIFRTVDPVDPYNMT